MTKPRKAGRWTEKFSANQTFDDELREAVEISHARNDTGGQINVELERIPGWVRPLWAIDSGWLYLRRPEGVWKTRISGLAEGQPIVLCQKFADGDCRGSEYVGERVAPTYGWMRRVGAPTSPAEMDEELSAVGFDVRADEVDNGLTEVIEDTAERYLMAAGELFDRPPAIIVDDNWLICVDASSGRRVAFSLDADPHVKEALRKGKLWLRFCGPYLEPFDVRVCS